MMAQKQMHITVDEGLIERVRNCSAATGYPISTLAELGLIGELAKLESKYGNSRSVHGSDFRSGDLSLEAGGRR